MRLPFRSHFECFCGVYTWLSAWHKGAPSEQRNGHLEACINPLCGQSMIGHLTSALWSLAIAHCWRSECFSAFITVRSKSSDITCVPAAKTTEIVGVLDRVQTDRHRYETIGLLYTLYVHSNKHTSELLGPFPAYFRLRNSQFDVMEFVLEPADWLSC